MTFGSPLTAGPTVTSPNTLVDSGQFTIAGAALSTLPAAAATYDVSAYSGVLLSISVSGAPVSTSMIVVDSANRAPEANQAASALQVPVSTTILVYQRVLAPFLRVFTFIPGAVGTATVAYRLYGTAQPMPYDGPYTPAFDGLQLAVINQALGIAGTASAHVEMAPGVGLPSLYAGKATLSLYGAGGAPVAAYVRTLTPAAALQTIGGVQPPPPPAGSLGVGVHGVTDLWVPPSSCELVVVNGGTAQTVQATLLVAG